MKLSRYNIIINKGDYAYWYNSLSRRYFKIPKGISDKIVGVMKINEDEVCLPLILKEKLIDGGFLIDRNIDELKIVRDRSKEAINSKEYFLIILPTLNCNYHCWYCIQDHIESKMSPDIMERIKKHIDYMINIEKIEALNLDWFGGEPFLYFSEVVEPISKYAQERCKKAEIPFRNSSTTNGYYLSSDIIDRCVKLDFKQFQITLDGNKEFHDKVKFYKGCDSTFSHVLKNINNILIASKEIRMYLRINYTHKNLSVDIVEEVNKSISPANRPQIVVTPRKVWQEDVDHDFNPILLNILDKFKESGYYVEYWSPASDYLSCYVNKKYYNTINYNGNVVKCTACNDLYDENPKGILKEDGTIIWKDSYEKKCQEVSYENARCLDCNKLPICMGLCPRDNLNKSDYCKEEVLDVPFETAIVDYIDRHY